METQMPSQDYLWKSKRKRAPQTPLLYTEDIATQTLNYNEWFSMSRPSGPGSVQFQRFSHIFDAEMSSLWSLIA